MFTTVCGAGCTGGGAGAATSGAGGLTPDMLINNAGLSTLGLVGKSVPEEEVNLVEVDVAAVVDL
ncbi:hypothetical protein OQ968_24225, partial [Mycobacterium sp. 663a-19]|nr:hypothetical protein [Mycobacterium sp. 663a-19]